MKDNFSKLLNLDTLNSKVNKISKVLKDPDGYNSGIASDSRVSKIEEAMANVGAKHPTPDENLIKLNQLEDKLVSLTELVTELFTKLESIDDKLENFEFNGSVEYGEPNHISNKSKKYLKLKSYKYDKEN